MYTFFQLLIRNTLLGLMFFISASYLTLHVVSDYLGSKNQEYKQVLSILANQVMINGEIENLGKILHDSAQFNELYISSFRGEEIYNYQRSSDAFILPLFPNQTIRIAIKKLDLTIKYQLNFNKESSILFRYLVILFIAVNLFIILACWLGIKKYKEERLEENEVPFNQRKLRLTGLSLLAG